MGFLETKLTWPLQLAPYLNRSPAKFPRYNLELFDLRRPVQTSSRMLAGWESSCLCCRAQICLFGVPLPIRRILLLSQQSFAVAECSRSNSGDAKSGSGSRRVSAACAPVAYLLE